MRITTPDPGLPNRRHSRTAAHGRVPESNSWSPAGLGSVEDLDVLEETVAILSDGAAPRQLEQAEREIAEGKGETVEELAKAMQSRS